MRIVALILSFLIFHQSMSFCTHHTAVQSEMTESRSCTMDMADDVKIDIDSSKKSCCEFKSKHIEKDNNEDTEKGCCGDNCRCFTCVNVIFQILNSELQSELAPIVVGEDINQLVFVHSYDYYDSKINPPRV